MIYIEYGDLMTEQVESFENEQNSRTDGLLVELFLRYRKNLDETRKSR